MNAHYQFIYCFIYPFIGLASNDANAICAFLFVYNGFQRLAKLVRDSVIPHTSDYTNDLEISSELETSMDFPVPFPGPYVKRENELLGIGSTSENLSGSTSSLATGLSLGGVGRSKTVSNVGGGGGTNGGAMHWSWAGFTKEEKVAREKVEKTTPMAEGVVVSTHCPAVVEKTVCNQENKSALTKKISVSSTSSSTSALSTASTWTSTKNGHLVKEGGHVDDDEEVGEDGVEQLPDVSGVIVKNNAGSTPFDVSVSSWSSLTHS
jgi:hypothetical protein